MGGGEYLGEGVAERRGEGDSNHSLDDLLLRVLANGEAMAPIFLLAKPHVHVDGDGRLLVEQSCNCK